MILILGASGYLGQAFASELRRRQIDVLPLSRRALDYTRFELLFDFVRKSKPEFLINAAGCNSQATVVACEAERAQALQANTFLPQTIARVCYLTRTAWGHVSSGSIYSGAKASLDGAAETVVSLDESDIRRRFDESPDIFRGFKETDLPNASFRSPPCSFYAGTKALAEEGLRWCDRLYIWRPNLIFDGDDHPGNLLSKLQGSCRIRDTISSFSNRPDFVRACLDLWARGAEFGAYHLVNPGALTTRRIISALKRTVCGDKSFNVRNETSGGVDTPEVLPSGSLLDTSKVNAAGIHLRPAEEALEDSLATWRPSGQNLAAMNSLLHSPENGHSSHS